MKKVVRMLLVAVLVAVFSGVSAQSTKIDSTGPGMNPATERIIYEQHDSVFPSGGFVVKYGKTPNVNDSTTGQYFVAGGTDTSNVVLHGLTPNTTYLCKVVYFFPIPMSSLIETFTTQTCPFQFGFTQSPGGKCVDTLKAFPRGPGYSYQWILNGVYIPGAVNWYYKANITSDYSVTVSNGTCSATSAPQSVIIPGITASATVDKSEICLGSSVKLSATVVNQTGNETFSWTSSPAGFTSTEQNPITVPPVTTNYFVVVTEGTCFNTSSTKVTVNKNNTNVNIEFEKDSVCNGGTVVDKGTGSPANGNFSGQFMNQNYFIPDTSFVGPSEVTYTVTDNNGCEASATKTLWVIDSPVIDTMYYLGTTFVIDGWFPYDISMQTGVMTYFPDKQSNKQALFYGRNVNDNEGVTVSSSVGGCFTIKPFHRFGLGIEEMNPFSYVKPGTGIDVYTITGMKIRTIVAPRELRSNGEMDTLLKDLLPNGVYLWYTNSGRTKGKSLIYHW